MLLLYNCFLSLLESIYRRGARRWRKLYRVNGHLFQAKRFNRVSVFKPHFNTVPGCWSWCSDVSTQLQSVEWARVRVCTQDKGRFKVVELMWTSVSWVTQESCEWLEPEGGILIVMPVTVASLCGWWCERYFCKLTYDNLCSCTDLILTHWCWERILVLAHDESINEHYTGST